MSYEAVSGLGAVAATTAGFFGRSTAVPESLPSPRVGEVRVPSAERGPLKAWYERYKGRSDATYQAWLRRDPAFSTSDVNALDLFRKTKRRVELIAQRGASGLPGVMCISGPRGSTSGPVWNANKTLDWWKQCDKAGWAVWNPDSMSQVLPRQNNGCVSVPTSLLNYWMEGYRARPAAVGCPYVTVRNSLFGFDALASEAANPPATLMHIYQFQLPSTTEAPSTPKLMPGLIGKINLLKEAVPSSEDEASSQAVEEAVETAQEVSPESEEAIETATTEQPRDIGKYLMWGAVGLVAAGGIGYLVYKYLRKPKTPPGFAGNPEDDGFGVHLRTDAPRDVKMVVKAMNRSVRLHLGMADPRAVRWSVWPDGRWVISDNFDRRKAALVKELDGSWTLHDYTARVTERLTQSQAERVAGMFFRGA